jgi:hypothetical protein
MDPLPNNNWSDLGHEEDTALERSAPAAGAAAEVTAVGAAGPSAGLEGTAPPGENRQSDPTRRRFDRGGRRRSDWPEDAGMSGCPGCGFESIQSLGMLDSGDYLWQCPQCDRRFNTGRATRTLL